MRIGAPSPKFFYQNPIWCAAMPAKIPAGRFGALDDPIGATLLVCSDAARYVIGQLLSIDGGDMASI